MTAEFAAAWYNWAAANDKQVVMNNRCGIPESDFDTPEYTTFSSVSARKWESNQGMDPFSYGYNRATPPEAYMNATNLITTLVDMVSKNGNLLLDIGPMADGTIDETEVATLKEAGKWIKAHGEAIYNTTYWYVHKYTLDTADRTDDPQVYHGGRWRCTLYADNRRILHLIALASTRKLHP